MGSDCPPSLSYGETGNPERAQGRNLHAREREAIPGGVRLSELLAFVGADPKARFLEARCADDYYESLDKLLCDEMYGRPLTREHGAPLRLVLPTKLGYKQAKYIVGLRVSDVLGPTRGYWVDQGYSWFGGL